MSTENNRAVFTAREPAAAPVPDGPHGAVPILAPDPEEVARVREGVERRQGESTRAEVLVIVRRLRAENVDEDGDGFALVTVRDLRAVLDYIDLQS